MSGMVKDKKKMQMMILGGIVAFGVIFALVHFWLAPTFAFMKKADKDTRTLQDKLDSASSFVKRRDTIEKELEDTKDRIREVAAGVLQSKLGNYILPAQDAIYRLAAEQGLKPDSIVEHDRIRPAGGGGNAFLVYRIRININCAYEELVKFIRTIEADNPYAVVSAVSVNPDIKNPRRHITSLIVGWVIWDNPARIPAFCREERKPDVEAPQQQ